MHTKIILWKLGDVASLVLFIPDLSFKSHNCQVFRCLNSANQSLTLIHRIYLSEKFWSFESKNFATIKKLHLQIQHFFFLLAPVALSGIQQKSATACDLWPTADLMHFK